MNEALSAPARAAGSLAGGLVLVGVGYALLGPVVRDFSNPVGEVVWVNPGHVQAGLGFAGLALWLLLLAVLGLAAAQRRPSPTTVGKAALAATFVVPLMAVLGASSLTRSFASRHGFVRCVPLDRFQAGNVPKNDVTLAAYAQTVSAQVTSGHCARP